MNLWKTLILAAIVGALGIYIARVEIPKDEQKKRDELLFAELKAGQIKSLSIKSADSNFTLMQEGVVAESTPSDELVEVVDVDASRWKIEGLAHAELEKPALNALVSALLTLKREYEIPSADVEKDLSVYGLKEPALTLTVTGPTKSWTLLVGKESEMLRKRYMKFAENDGIFMSASSFYGSANKKRDDLRDKTPVDFFDSQLAKLQLANDKLNMTVEAAGNLNWRILSPVVYTASNVAVTDLLRGLRNLQAAEYIDAPGSLADYGLEKPFATAQLTFNENAKREPLKIAVGKGTKGDAAYLSIEGRPTIFRLSSDPSATVGKQLDDFREKQPLKFQYDEVVSAEFKPQSGETIALQREGDEWKINGKDADGPFVKTVLDNLAGISADGFPVTTLDYGFSKPFMTWTLMVRDSLDEKQPAKKVSFVVGDRADANAAKRYAASGDLSEAIIISEESLAKITPRVETLLKPEPTPSAEPSAAATAAQ